MANLRQAFLSCLFCIAALQSAGCATNSVGFASDDHAAIEQMQTRQRNLERQLQAALARIDELQNQLDATGLVAASGKTLAEQAIEKSSQTEQKLGTMYRQAVFK